MGMHKLCVGAGSRLERVERHMWTTDMCGHVRTCHCLIRMVRVFIPVEKCSSIAGVAQASPSDELREDRFGEPM